MESAGTTVARMRPVRRRWLRRTGYGVLALFICAVEMVAAGWIALDIEDSGTPSPAAHGTGGDAEWLGHAWVDGRKTQADVDALAAQLRRSGIHDLFVHAGPFRDDGTLDPALRPDTTWVIGALHAALPGVRCRARSAYGRRATCTNSRPTWIRSR